MKQGSSVLVAMLIGLGFGAFLGTLVAPIFAVAAMVVSALGGMPTPLPIAPGTSWIAVLGLAALWGVQLGGVLGMVYALLDAAWASRNRTEGAQ